MDFFSSLLISAPGACRVVANAPLLMANLKISSSTRRESHEPLTYS